MRCDSLRMAHFTSAAGSLGRIPRASVLSSPMAIPGEHGGARSFLVCPAKPCCLFRFSGRLFCRLLGLVFLPRLPHSLSELFHRFERPHFEQAHQRSLFILPLFRRRILQHWVVLVWQDHRLRLVRRVGCFGEFSEFMIFSFRLHHELVVKQKPPDHQGRRLATSPAEILFGEFPHRTSAGIFVPALGTVGSPLPGCQTRFGVVPDVGRKLV